MSSTHDQYAQQGGSASQARAQAEPQAGPQAGQHAGQQAGQQAGQRQGQYVPRPSSAYDDETRDRGDMPGAAVVGWSTFAAVAMMMSGLWSFLEGLSAIIRGQFFIQLPNYSYNISVHGWGWTHLILGIVVFLAGACLLTDMLWARIAGVALAVISAVLNFVYIPYQPVWSIIVIALDVFVIWALLAPRPGRRHART